jgi:hypothetical protein
MRVYVAGRTADQERVRRVQGLCREAGHTITFDWTGPDGDIRSDWRSEAERAAELSKRELEAVATADVLVLCGPDPHGGLGCYIETGMAMAMGLSIVIIEPVRESVFWYLPGVVRCQEDTLDTAIKGLM